MKRLPFLLLLTTVLFSCKDQSKIDAAPAADNTKRNSGDWIKANKLLFGRKTETNGNYTEIFGTATMHPHLHQRNNA